MVRPAGYLIDIHPGRHGERRVLSVGVPGTRDPQAGLNPFIPHNAHDRASRARTGRSGMAAISAHGPRTGTIEAYARALETGAEYVEFDIRRTADGELAAFHDPRTRQGEVLAAVSYP